MTKIDVSSGIAEESMKQDRKQYVFLFMAIALAVLLSITVLTVMASESDADYISTSDCDLADNNCTLKITPGSSKNMADYSTATRVWESLSGFSKSNITKVYIGGDVKNIGAYAFKDYTSLTQVVFYNAYYNGTCESIDSHAFDGCTSLAHVYQEDRKGGLEEKFLNDIKTIGSYQ